MLKNKFSSSEWSLSMHMDIHIFYSLRVQFTKTILTRNQFDLSGIVIIITLYVHCTDRIVSHRSLWLCTVTLFMFMDSFYPVFVAFGHCFFYSIPLSLSVSRLASFRWVISSCRQCVFIRCIFSIVSFATESWSCYHTALHSKPRINYFRMWLFFCSSISLV